MIAPQMIDPSPLIVQTSLLPPPPLLSSQNIQFDTAQASSTATTAHLEIAHSSASNSQSSMRTGEGLREGGPSPPQTPLLTRDDGGSLVVVWTFPACDTKGTLWCIAVNCPRRSSLRLKSWLGNGRAELGTTEPPCWGSEEGGFGCVRGWCWGWFAPQGGCSQLPKLCTVFIPEGLRSAVFSCAVLLDLNHGMPEFEPCCAC